MADSDVLSDGDILSPSEPKVSEATSTEQQKPNQDQNDTVKKSVDQTKTPEQLEQEKLEEERRRIAEEFMQNNSELFNTVLNLQQSFRMQKDKVADSVRENESNKLSPEAQAQLQAHNNGKGGLGFLERMKQKKQKQENTAERQKLMTLNSPEVNSRMESISRSMQQFAEKSRDIKDITSSQTFKSIASLSDASNFPNNLNVAENEFYQGYLQKRLEISELAKETGKDIQFLKDHDALQDNAGKYIKDMKGILDKTVNDINNNPDVKKMDAKDSGVFDKIKDNMKEMTESLVNSFKNVFNSIGNVFAKGPSM